MGPQDLEGIFDYRLAAWEAEVRQQQLVTQARGSRSSWRRHAGYGVARIGRQLTQWGEAMAEGDGRPSVPVAG